MRKILTILFVFVSILAFTGCSGGEEHTYVVPPKACNTLFSNSPEDVVLFKDESPWIDGNYVSMEEDEDGNLVIVLNDKHVEHWREEILDIFKKINEADAQYGLGVYLSEDYTEMKYYTNKDVYDVSAIGIGLIFPYCGILQMLDGVDPNEWYVDIKVIDVDTGITVKEGRLPDDKKFGVKKEDWEKAIGTAE